MMHRGLSWQVVIFAGLVPACAPDDGPAVGETANHGEKSSNAPGNGKNGELALANPAGGTGEKLRQEPENSGEAKESEDREKPEPKSRREVVLKEYDANRDGVLQREEWESYLKERRELDPDRGKSKVELTKREKKRQSYRDVGQPGLRGDRLALIRKFDKDEDGELSSTEMAAARAYLKEEKAKKANPEEETTKDSDGN